TAGEACLLLKGADALYPSREWLNDALCVLTAAARERVAGRVQYHGATFSARQMASLMRAADCYVAPYLAEGFNLPVLEAAASGVPIICTGGGPTDDFTEPLFATRIDSRIVPVSIDRNQSGDMLAPDLAHLISSMRDAVADPDHMHTRGMGGVRYVAERYTW